MAFRQNRNQGSFSRRGVKRLTEWGICSVPAGYTTVPAASKILLVLVPAATLSPESPATVVRSRFLLSVISDQTVATEAQVGAFGIGFVNIVAGALGVTGIPGPATDCAWDGWFVWQPIAQQLVVATAVGVEGQFATNYTIDSKAMRKFGEDMSLAMMIENTSGSDGFSALISGRMLIKAG